MTEHPETELCQHYDYVNHTTRPMLGMLIPQIWRKGAPMVVDIGTVGKSVSELLQAVYTKP